MGGAGVWARLAESAFLADVVGRDRDPARLAVTVVGGVTMGLVAAFACWIAVLAPYTLMTGLGAEGLQGLGKAAVLFNQPGAHGLGVTLLQMLGQTSINGVFWLAFVAVAATLAAHPLHAYLTVAAKVRWRLLAAGLALSLLAVGPLVLAERWLSSDGTAAPILGASPNLAGRFAYGFSALLLIPAAAAEELMFRGWLLRQLAAFTRRTGVLILAGGVAFAIAHLEFDAQSFINLAVMGAGFTYMTLRLGGIEFSTGAHAVNNMLIVLFVAPLSAQTSAPDWSLPGAVVGDVILAIGYVVITEAVARIGPLRRWSGVRLEEISPPVAGAVASA